MTAAYVYIDLEKDILKYADEGQTAGFDLAQVRQQRKPASRKWIGDGPVRGAEYDSIQIPVQAGDRFDLYTGGIFESCSPAGDEFGTD